MDKLSPIVIETFTKLMQTTICNVTILQDGISNINYLINGKYAMKVKTPSLDPFGHLQNDARIQNLMADLGLSAPVLASDDETGILISAYLENTRYLSDQPTKKEFTLVANTLQKLHQLPVDDVRLFDPINRYLTYQRLGQVPPLFPKLEAELLEEFRLYFDNTPLRLCHNDVVRGNLLFQGEKLLLIDYEYAGLNDPLFDHLSFLTENDIDSDENLKLYFSDVLQNHFPITEDFLKRYITLIDLLWYYWAEAYYQKTKKAIFAEIALSKKQRLCKRLT
ncbi:MAG: phosphotransferase [Bacilli bacterium]|jgi:thiamine kinase-like enzyme